MDILEYTNMSADNEEKMKIAICDDEIQITKLLHKQIEKYFNGICNIDIFYSGIKLVNANCEYDVYFLDIAIGDVNGIELANIIRKKNKESFIVFVTNYEEYCRQALGVHAFGYIVKPIKEQELFGILDEIREYSKNSRHQDDLIRLKTTCGIVQININQIQYFEYESRKVKLVLENNSLFVNYTLEDIYNLLKKNDFAMPHRAYIVNLKKIKLINKYDILMENGDKVPLAQKKTVTFKKNFNIYLYKQL